MRGLHATWGVVFALLIGCGGEPVVGRDTGTDTPPGDVATADATTDATNDVASDVADAADAADANPCPGAERRCGSVCVDVSTNPMHCGMCDRPCGPNSRCATGMCQPTCGVAGLPCCSGMGCDEFSQCSGGMCVARGTDTPPHRGVDLVGAGNVMTSTNYQLISTLGQSTIHQSTMTSTNFRLRGGLMGAVGGRR